MYLNCIMCISATHHTAQFHIHGMHVPSLQLGDWDAGLASTSAVMQPRSAPTALGCTLSYLPNAVLVQNPSHSCDEAHVHVQALCFAQIANDV